MFQTIKKTSVAADMQTHENFIGISPNSDLPLSSTVPSNRRSSLFGSQIGSLGRSSVMGLFLTGLLTLFFQVNQLLICGVAVANNNIQTIEWRPNQGNDINFVEGTTDYGTRFGVIITEDTDGLDTQYEITEDITIEGVTTSKIYHTLDSSEHDFTTNHQIGWPLKDDEKKLVPKNNQNFFSYGDWYVSRHYRTDQHSSCPTTFCQFFAFKPNSDAIKNMGDNQIVTFTFSSHYYKDRGLNIPDVVPAASRTPPTEIDSLRILIRGPVVVTTKWNDDVLTDDEGHAVINIYENVSNYGIIDSKINSVRRAGEFYHYHSAVEYKNGQDTPNTDRGKADANEELPEGYDRSRTHVYGKSTYDYGYWLFDEKNERLSFKPNSSAIGNMNTGDIIISALCLQLKKVSGTLSTDCFRVTINKSGVELDWNDSITWADNEIGKLHSGVAGDNSSILGSATIKNMPDTSTLEVSAVDLVASSRSTQRKPFQSSSVTNAEIGRGFRSKVATDYGTWYWKQNNSGFEFDPNWRAISALPGDVTAQSIFEVAVKDSKGTLAKETLMVTLVGGGDATNEIVANLHMKNDSSLAVKTITAGNGLEFTALLTSTLFNRSVPLSRGITLHYFVKEIGEGNAVTGFGEGPQMRPFRAGSSGSNLRPTSGIGTDANSNAPSTVRVSLVEGSGYTIGDNFPEIFFNIVPTSATQADREKIGDWSWSDDFGGTIDVTGAAKSTYSDYSTSLPIFAESASTVKFKVEGTSTKPGETITPSGVFTESFIHEDWEVDFRGSIAKIGYNTTKGNGINELNSQQTRTTTLVITIEDSNGTEIDSERITVTLQARKSVVSIEPAGDYSSANSANFNIEVNPPLVSHATLSYTQINSNNPGNPIPRNVILSANEMNFTSLISPSFAGNDWIEITLGASNDYDIDPTANQARIMKSGTNTPGISISADSRSIWEGYSTKFTLSSTAAPGHLLRHNVTISWEPAGLVTSVCGRFPANTATSVTCTGSKGLKLAASSTSQNEADKITVVTDSNVLSSANGTIRAILDTEQYSNGLTNPAFMPLYASSATRANVIVQDIPASIPVLSVNATPGIVIEGPNRSVASKFNVFAEGGANPGSNFKVYFKFTEEGGDIFTNDDPNTIQEEFVNFTGRENIFSGRFTNIDWSKLTDDATTESSSVGTLTLVDHPDSDNPTYLVKSPPANSASVTVHDDDKNYASVHANNYAITAGENVKFEYRLDSTPGHQIGAFIDLTWEPAGLVTASSIDCGMFKSAPSMPTTQSSARCEVRMNSDQTDQDMADNITVTTNSNVKGRITATLDTDQDFSGLSNPSFAPAYLPGEFAKSVAVFKPQGSGEELEMNWLSGFDGIIEADLNSSTYPYQVAHVSENHTTATPSFLAWETKDRMEVTRNCHSNADLSNSSVIQAKYPEFTGSTVKILPNPPDNGQCANNMNATGTAFQFGRWYVRDTTSGFVPNSTCLAKKCYHLLFVPDANSINKLAKGTTTVSTAGVILLSGMTSEAEVAIPVTINTPPPPKVTSGMKATDFAGIATPTISSTDSIKVTIETFEKNDSDANIPLTNDTRIEYTVTEVGASEVIEDAAEGEKYIEYARGTGPASNNVLRRELVIPLRNSIGINGSGTVKLAMVDTGDYRIAPEFPELTFTIVPKATIAIESYAHGTTGSGVTEGHSFDFTVTRKEGVTESPITIPVTVSRSGTGKEDVNPQNSANAAITSGDSFTYDLVIPSGRASVTETITLDSTSDVGATDNVKIDVAISDTEAHYDAEVGKQSIAVSVKDNDSATAAMPRLSIAANAGSVQERQTAMFTVTANVVSGNLRSATQNLHPIRVYFKVDATGDFIAEGQTFEFVEMGATSDTVPINVRSKAGLLAPEATGKAITVTLVDGNGYSLPDSGSSTNATVTLTDALNLELEWDNNHTGSFNADGSASYPNLTGTITLTREWTNTAVATNVTEYQGQRETAGTSQDQVTEFGYQGRKFPAKDDAVDGSGTALSVTGVLEFGSWLVEEGGTRITFKPSASAINSQIDPGESVSQTLSYKVSNADNTNESLTETLTVEISRSQVDLSIAATGTKVATEGSAANFTVTSAGGISGDSFAVYYSITEEGDFIQAASNQSQTLEFAKIEGSEDVTAQLAIQIPDDSVDEPRGSVTVTLANDTQGKYTVSTTANSDTVAIYDISQQVVQIASDWAGSTGYGVTEGYSFDFTLTRTSSQTSALQVPITIESTGEGKDGVNFTNSAGDSLTSGNSLAYVLTIDANEDTVTDTVILDATSNVTSLDNVAIVVSISSDETNYAAGTNSSISVTVKDNDSPSAALPVLKVESEQKIRGELEEITEGEGENFHFTPSPQSASNIMVNYEVTAKEEFLADDQTFEQPAILPAGAQSTNFRIISKASDPDEPMETITVTLLEGKGYVLPNEQSLSVARIILRDRPGAALSWNNFAGTIISDGSPSYPNIEGTVTVTSPWVNTERDAIIYVTRGGERKNINKFVNSVEEFGYSGRKYPAKGNEVDGNGNPLLRNGQPITGDLTVGSWLIQLNDTGTRFTFKPSATGINVGVIPGETVVHTMDYKITNGNNTKDSLTESISLTVTRPMVELAIVGANDKKTFEGDTAKFRITSTGAGQTDVRSGDSFSMSYSYTETGDFIAAANGLRQTLDFTENNDVVSALLEIAIPDDGAGEPAGSITVTLEPTSGVYTVSDTERSDTVEILDKTRPQLSIKGLEPVANQPGAVARFAINASIPVANPITVYFSAIGDFVGNYTPSQLLSFADGMTDILEIPLNSAPSNSLSGEIRVEMVADITGSSYSLSSDANQHVADVQVYNVSKFPILSVESVDEYVVERESAMANFYVLSTFDPGNTLAVHYELFQEGDFYDSTLEIDSPLTDNITLTADSTGKYAAQVAFPIHNDTIRESTGRLGIRLLNDDQTTISYLLSGIANSISATVNVYDDDLPEISILDGPNVVEGDPDDSEVTADFTIKTFVSPNNSIFVRYLPTGESFLESGVSGVEKSIILDFNGNTTEVILSLKIDNDTIEETSGEVTVQLLRAESIAYAVSSENHTATVLVIDNDSAPKLSVFATTEQVVESENASVRFTVLASYLPSEPLPVRYRLTNTGYLPQGLANLVLVADPPLSFIDQSSTGNGPFTAEIEVPLASDETPEPSELLTISLLPEILSPPRYELAENNNSASVTIIDDDGGGNGVSLPEVSISSDRTEVNKGGKVEIAILATGSRTSPISVNLRTAQVGGFVFWVVPRVVTLQVPGIKTFTIQTGDLDADANGSVTVELLPGDGYRLPAINTGKTKSTIEIINSPQSSASNVKYSVVSAVITEILLGIGNTETQAPPGSENPKLPVVAIGSDVASIDEGEAAVFAVTAETELDSALEVLVELTQQGQFISGEMTRVVEIKRGYTFGKLVVLTDNDELAEEDGLITAILVAGEKYLVTSQIQGQIATVTVSDAHDRFRHQQALARAYQNINTANRILLPEMAAAMGSKTLAVASQRMEQAVAENTTSSFNLNNLATIRDLVELGGDRLNGERQRLQSLLDGVTFAAGIHPEPGIANNATIWGRSDFNDLTEFSSSQSLDWTGEIFTGQLGFDAKVGEGLLTGLSVSVAESQARFNIDDESIVGYEINHTGLLPYFGITSPDQSFKLNATASYALGEMKVDAEVAGQEILDTTISSFAASGSKRLFSNEEFLGGAGKLELTGEAWQATHTVAGNGSGIEDLQASANYLQWALQGSHRMDLSAGKLIASSFLIGVLGEEKSNQKFHGSELASEVRYETAAGLILSSTGKSKFSLGQQLRSVQLEGLLVYDQNRDELGLNLQFSPVWSRTADNSDSRSWNKNSMSSDFDLYGDDTSAKLELGYGFLVQDGAWKLTPYGNLEWSEVGQDQIQLGKRFEYGQNLSIEFAGTAEMGLDRTLNPELDLKGKLSW